MFFLGAAPAPPLSSPPRPRTRLPLHYHRQAASQPATAHRAAQPMMSYHDYDPVQKNHMHSFIALVQSPYRDVEKGVPLSPLDQAGLASFRSCLFLLVVCLYSIRAGGGRCRFFLQVKTIYFQLNMINILIFMMCNIHYINCRT